MWIKKMENMRWMPIAIFYVGLLFTPTVLGEKCTDSAGFKECQTQLENHIADVRKFDHHQMNEDSLEMACDQLMKSVQCVKNHSEKCELSFEEKTKVTLEIKGAKEIWKRVCSEDSSVRQVYQKGANCTKVAHDDIRQKCKNYTQLDLTDIDINELVKGKEGLQSLATEKVKRLCCYFGFQTQCLGSEVRRRCGSQGWDYFKILMNEGQVMEFKVATKCDDKYEYSSEECSSILPQDIVQTMKKEEEEMNNEPQAGMMHTVNVFLLLIGVMTVVGCTGNRLS